MLIQAQSSALLPGKNTEKQYKKTAKKEIWKRGNKCERKQRGMAEQAYPITYPHMRTRREDKGKRKNRKEKGTTRRGKEG